LKTTALSHFQLKKFHFSSATGENGESAEKAASIRFNTTSQDYGRYLQLQAECKMPPPKEQEPKRQLGPKFSQLQAAIGMYRNSSLN
jgi:hypothetical protein